MSRPVQYSCLLITCFAVLAAAQVPDGWSKITGAPDNWSAQPDGIMDRGNSYAWSMAVLEDSLYVGTNRNIFARMVQMAGLTPWPAAVPHPMQYDSVPRIYRMNVQTRAWQEIYRSPVNPATGQPADVGFRMMKTFTAPGKPPVLYVGSAAFGSCRLLAIRGGVIQSVFNSPPKMAIPSIRAIEEHSGMLYWASEDTAGPAIWYSPDPIGDFEASREFKRLTSPPAGFNPARSEVTDMISANGSLYVFYLAYPPPGAGMSFLQGFWCIKGKWVGGKWIWTPIAGLHPDALYPPGIDDPHNGGAVPFRFKNHVYVGTMEGATFRMMSGLGGGTLPPPPPGGYPAEATIAAMGGRHGMQIYRFDPRDRWERAMASTGLSSGPEAARGFGNELNKYIWRFGEQNGRLYAGTFDMTTGVDILAGGSSGEPGIRGFDLCSTTNGEQWTCESRDGFLDPFNYGVRTFATDPNTGVLYLGTANPFYGCQVWMRPPGKK